MTMGLTSRVYFESLDLSCISDHFSIKSKNHAYNFNDSFSNIIIVSRSLVKPPIRDNGELWFRDFTSIESILNALVYNEKLPPIEVKTLTGSSEFQYTVIDGFHRFYLSLATNYSHLPVLVNNWSFET